MDSIIDIDKKTLIQNLFDENEIDDLKRFLDERKRLNSYNSYMIYFFHIFQSVGILTTTIATGYNSKEYIWVGIGFNFLASLVNVFEQTNNNISKHLLNDITAIKNGNYVDEEILVETKKSSKNDSNV